MRLGDIRVPVRLPEHVFPAYGPPHETDGSPCWCQPQRVCVDCRQDDWRQAIGLCVHGADRAEIVIHREPS